MPYDERLAERVRRALLERGIAAEERKMFGGLAFMVAGHMTVGIVNSDLMVRTGPSAYAKALVAPHARPMDFTGRPMTGMVYVARGGTSRTAQVGRWLDAALAHTATLPSKARARRR